MRYLHYQQHDYRPDRWNGDDAPLSSWTVRNIWNALRSFWTWASDSINVPHIMERMPPPKAATKETMPLSADDVKAMLAQVKPVRARHPRSGRHYGQLLRDQAIILVLLDTGIRVGELCQLIIGDAHFQTGRLSIQGKGAKHRFVYMASMTRTALWQYLAERVDGDDPQHPLFCTQSGKRMRREWVRKRLHDIGANAGVDDVHPHHFRRTFAIQYLRNGGGIFTLQMLLGHSSLKMVRYYARLADVDSERVHAKASPVDRWLK